MTPGGILPSCVGEISGVVQLGRLHWWEPSWDSWCVRLVEGGFVGLSVGAIGELLASLNGDVVAVFVGDYVELLVSLNSFSCVRGTLAWSLGRLR